MRVFITGGTGFIGQCLVRSMVRNGHEVIVLVRTPDSAAARLVAGMGARLARGDVTDRESMRDAVTGVDAVVHNAGHYEFGLDAAARRRMVGTNIVGTENVLGLALELRVPRSVHVSSVVALGETGREPCDESFTRRAPVRTWYEQTKTEAHALAARYGDRGLPVAIVCPNAVIGPNDHSVWGYFLRMYLNRVMPPVCWSPDRVMSLVPVEDLADGMTLVTEKGRMGETYLLTGEPRTVRETVEIWKQRPGAHHVRFWLPAGLMAAACWPLEPLLRLAGMPAFLSRETVRAVMHLNYSSRKAQQELGWAHRSAEAMWLGTIDAEMALLAARGRAGLASRLNPLPPGS